MDINSLTLIQCDSNIRLIKLQMYFLNRNNTCSAADKVTLNQAYVILLNKVKNRKQALQNLDLKNK